MFPNQRCLLWRVGPVRFGSAHRVSHPCAPQLVDMEGWTLMSSDRQVVPHELREEGSLLYADLRRIPEGFPELYWQAPPSYLGDRVSRHIGPGEECLCAGRRGGSKRVFKATADDWTRGQGLAWSHSSVRSPGVILRGDPPL